MATSVAQGGKLPPLTCLDFIEIISRVTRRIGRHLIDVQLPGGIISHDTPLIKLLKWPGYIYALLMAANKVGCVILIHTGKLNTFKVVFDASFLSPTPVYIFLRKNGSRCKAHAPGKWATILKKIKIKEDSESVGNTFQHYFKCKDDSEPTSIDQVLKNVSNIDVKFIVCRKPLYSILLQKSWKTKKEDKVINILHVFYNHERKLRFDMDFFSFPRPLPNPQPLLTIMTKNDEKDFKGRNNRHTSIFVKEQGLNLALRLGIISTEEFMALSTFMAKCCGFITFKIGNTPRCKKICKIFYSDEQSQYVCKIPSQWTCLFNHIDHMAKVMNGLKMKYLNFVFNRLEKFSKCSINSIYKQCGIMLKQHCNKFKCFTFGTDDTIMHTLKVPMAIYYRRKFPNSKKSVFIKCSKGNDILSLSYKHISITNIGQAVGIVPSSNLDATNLILKETCLHWTGNELCDLAHLYQSLNSFHLDNFKIDITTLPFISMANLSNLIFWQLYLEKLNGSWLVHPIEQTLNYNREKLRGYCKGGFSYSAQCELNAGDALYNKNIIAKSIINLDIVASYGYAAANMAAGCGFGSTFENGQRIETSQRYKFFEFRAVFYCIYDWEFVQNKKLLAVFSNYSPLGVFYIGNYPIDLVGIFEDGSCEIVQFDSAYCHGCMCCILPSYADGKTRDELNKKTRERDCFTVDWIQSTGIKANYRICTDCCNPLFKKLNLDRQFKIIPQLKNLIDGYSSIVTDNLDRVHKDITFIAIVKFNNLPKFGKFGGPLFSTLLTKDYYHYLKTTFPSLEIAVVNWVVFYKRDYTFNKVYDQLLTAREDYAGNIKQFFKSVINLSCGYFGTNLAKNKTKFIRITNKTPPNFNLETHTIIPLEPNDEDLYIIKTNAPLKMTSLGSSYSLIHFCMIIEYGKMRMDEIFYMYYSQLRPHSFDILYAHIDSTIITLSTNCIEEAANCPSTFEKIKEDYFNGKKPGCLKTVWHYNLNDNWAFITCRQSSYALLTNNFATAKMPNVLNTHAKNVFEAQQQLLTTKCCVISQERKKNKIAGPHTNIKCKLNFKM